MPLIVRQQQYHRKNKKSFHISKSLLYHVLSRCFPQKKSISNEFEKTQQQKILLILTLRNHHQNRIIASEICLNISKLFQMNVVSLNWVPKTLWRPWLLEWYAQQKSQYQILYVATMYLRYSIHFERSPLHMYEKHYECVELLVARSSPL